jgi:hypothetical protein
MCDHIVQRERARRACSDGPFRVGFELGWDRAGIEDRVAPVVEGDQLREKLCAHTVGVAFDPVDA